MAVGRRCQHEQAPRSTSRWLAVGISAGLHAALIVPALLLSAALPKDKPVPALPYLGAPNLRLTLGLFRQGNPRQVKKPVDTVRPPAPTAKPEPVPVIYPVAVAPAPTNSMNVAPPVTSKIATPGGVSGASGGVVARGNGEGTAGGPSLLKAPTQARTVVYVLDRSLSMGLTGALDVACGELLASLAQLPETTRFQVIFYNREAVPLRLNDSTDLQFATTANRRQVAREVEQLRAAADTDHVNALKRALYLQPDVIFLVTDGDGLSSADVATLTNINHGRCTIDVVELRTTRPDGASSLQLLARCNRGTYQMVNLSAPGRVAGDLKGTNPALPGGSASAWPPPRPGDR